MPKSRRRKITGRRRSRQRQVPSWSVSLMHQTAQYPLRECLINKRWREDGIASISLARNRPDGRVAVGAFAVDLGCMGVKHAVARPSLSVGEYDRMFARGAATNQVPCDPAFGVKLILGAVEYAGQLGFRPDPEYHAAKEIFGDIDPASCQETIEYGRDGKPFYFAGPYDDSKRIMKQLTERLGPNGFHYVVPLGPPDMFDDEFEEFEEDESDDE